MGYDKQALGHFAVSNNMAAEKGLEQKVTRQDKEGQVSSVKLDGQADYDNRVLGHIVFLSSGENGENASSAV